MKAILIGSSLNDIKVYPDSAVGRDAMPLFLPDGQWDGSLSLVFRIGRLGKNVREKFVLRYIDGLSGALTLVCDAPWITIIDNSVTPGHFLPYDAESHIALQIQNPPLDPNLQSQVPAIELLLDPTETLQRISKAVAQITSVATIKTGDIILLPLPTPTIPLLPNTRLQINLNALPVLNLKIK